VSSSGTSTTATRSPVVGASADDADVIATVAIVATATAAAPCYGPVTTVAPRGGSPVAAALAAARVTLDERRLVGTDASDLSTLAGTSAGTVGVALQMGNTRVNIDPSRLKTHGGNVAHLRLEKPRFLFLQGSGGAPVAPAGAAVALVGTSAALAGSSTHDPAAGASMPASSASSAVASATHGDGSGGFHLSGGAPRHSLIPPPPPPPPPTTRSSLATRGESPCCLRSWYSSSCCSRRSRRLILLSFARAARSCFRRYAARAAA
jgi:hypothetical protein